MRKIQTFKRYETGVSRAVWPAKVRRHVATSRVAQSRRSMIMKKLCWSSAIAYWCTRFIPWMQSIYRHNRLDVRLAITLLIGGLILTACTLYHGLTLFILVAICLAANIFTTYFLFKEPHTKRFLPQRTWRRPHITRKVPSSPRSSETPMPTLYITRVLGTIDLSSSAIEFFTETKKRPTPFTVIREQQSRYAEIPIGDKK